jgi:hypothetical protein
MGVYAVKHAVHFVDVGGYGMILKKQLEVNVIKL